MRIRANPSTDRATRAVAFIVSGLALLAPSAALAATIATGDAGPRMAYVDPGSGSFILQALVATLAGAAVAINAYWAKIKRVFGRGAPEEDDDAAGKPPSDD